MSIVDFYTAWFKNADWWFNGTKHDAYLEQTYGHLLHSTDLPRNLTEHKMQIVLYDQLSAHCKRVNPEVYFKDYRSQSLSLVQGILDIIEDSTNTLFTPEERFFCLLPLRHTQQLDNVYHCLNVVNKFRAHADHNIYQRFHRATLMQINKLVTPLIVEEPASDLSWVDILDQRASKVFPTSLTFDSCSLSDKIINNLKLLSDDKFAVSLSGGVDSMVMGFVMHDYCLKKNIELIFLHVNYNNRDCCLQEVSMLRAWTQLLGRPLYVRHITEIKRTFDKNRTMYEEVTRDARFSLYRRFNCPVFLGHNLDDTEENIISNIKKQKNYHNLRGMSVIGTESGVDIIRPMIEVPKKEIYAFADKYQIPYFYDSTNPECERGKHRLVLFPFLDKYDKNLVPGLNNLAAINQELFKIQDIFVQQLLSSEKDGVFVLNKVEDLGYGFWSSFVYAFVKQKNIRGPSHVSVQNFVKRLNGRYFGGIEMTKMFSFLYMCKKDNNIIKFVSKI
jgi:tRNA(Ile)-lysidine synthase